jgi:hypothetical protein
MTKFTGCDSIQQEITGKSNLQDGIQSNGKLHEKPNSWEQPNAQDVIQSDCKSQEIKGKTKFTECDLIQQ